MKKIILIADKLLCKICGKPIPPGTTKCTNPLCSLSKPLEGKINTK